MARTSTTKTTRSTKTASRKTPAKKAAPRKARRQVALEFAPVKSKMNRVQIIQTLVDNVEGIDKKQAKSMLDTLGQMMMASVCPKSIGVFTLPGILTMKAKHIKAKKIPAIKKGTEVTNRFTGVVSEHPGRKAGVKPATTKVKLIPMGPLKQAAL